jgi:competence protein ComEC
LLKIGFLDVGQGDSIYIETPSGRRILIDGGPDNSVLRKLSFVNNFWQRSFDIVLATHPDSDHITGLIELIRRYRADSLLITGIGKDNGVYDELLKAAYEKEKKGELSIVNIGGYREIDLGDGVIFYILAPESFYEGEESNDLSLVTLLKYKNHSFLFTGDAPAKVELDIIKKYNLDNLTVLKAGHHGSNSASDVSFIERVRPVYTVISSGKDNKYGHPHVEVLNILEKFKSIVLRTDEKGSILFKTDGENISIETEK